MRILDEAVDDAVRLSHRYITGRQLPDKSVSLLDTACARVALGQNADAAAPSRTASRQIEHLDVEIGILERESATGADHERAARRADRAERRAPRRGWPSSKRAGSEEKQLVEEIREPARASSKPHARGDGEGRRGNGQAVAAASAEELATLAGRAGDDSNDELRKRPGRDAADAGRASTRQTVAEVVSGWTGIPVGKMVRDEIETVLTLEERLEERVIGQAHALEAIGQRIRTARANLDGPAAADRRVPARRARAASARPRRRWPWPTCSTAASAT